MTARPILVGCPPSSGAMLFRMLLDGHSDVFCGPELGLLAHPLVFREPFTRFRHQALRHLRRGSFSVPRRSAPWKARHRAGLNPYLDLHRDNLESYGLNRRSLRSLLRRSKSLDDFMAGLFGRPLADAGKTIWAEGCPSNLYSFGDFLRRFPEGRVVTLVRDPRDAICGLMRRGFGFKRSVAVWLVETALCDRFTDHPRAMRVRYEDLVAETGETMERVFAFLDLPHELDTLLGGRDRSQRLRASRDSIGQWRENLSPVQNIALIAARIRRRGRGLDLPVGLSVGDLMHRLGYDFEPLRPARSLQIFTFLQEERFLPNARYPKRSRVFQERLVGCAVDRIPSWPTRRPVWAEGSSGAGGATALPVHGAS